MCPDGARDAFFSPPWQNTIPKMRPLRECSSRAATVRHRGQELTREEIVHKYLHLVKYVAGRVSVNLPPNVELNDLINDGILGLIDAIEKYDDSRGVKFETYAITRINGAILDALRALDWVPRAVRQRARELDRTIQELEIALGRPATNDEIADRMSVSVKELDVLMQKIRGTALLSLEDHLPNEKGYEVSLIETLRDADGNVAETVESHEITKALGLAVDQLSAQERTVISLYYFEGLTLKEIKVVLKRVRVTCLADSRASGHSSAPETS